MNPRPKPSSAAGQIHLGRQPILDRAQRVVAYELLFRSGREHNQADVTNTTQATAEVISHAFSDLGIGSILGNSECFINLGKGLLMSELVELLPKARVVLEILEDVVPDAALVARCRQLRDQGFRLALDDYAQAPQFAPLLDVVDLVKVDLMSLDLDRVVDMRRQLPEHIRILAEKVESHMDFEICLNNGYDLFQGYFFARPHIVSARRNDPKRSSILRLIGLLAADAETEDLVRVFKQEATLCYKLFGLVNAVGNSGPVQINGITDAITHLGRRQLQRWLQILLFAQATGMDPGNPVLQTAAQRGKLLDGLARHTAPQDRAFQDRAFMTGLFSLLDVLLEMNADEALNMLHIHGEARAAILHREGNLGEALRLCEALEQGDFLVVKALVDAMGIDGQEMIRLQVASMRWADTLGQGLANLP